MTPSQITIELNKRLAATKLQGVLFSNGKNAEIKDGLIYAENLGSVFIPSDFSNLQSSRGIYSIKLFTKKGIGTGEVERKADVIYQAFSGQMFNGILIKSVEIHKFIESGSFVLMPISITYETKE